MALTTKRMTFLDGLNMATSLAHGHGGVWVMNPPYLLFYPDKDSDDLPDGDPIVHLKGILVGGLAFDFEFTALGTGRLAIRCARFNRFRGYCLS